MTESPVSTTDSTDAPARPVRTWVALVVAALCTAYEVLCGVVLHVFQIGFLALLPIVPAYIAAIMLLVWVGRQGVPLAGRIAVVVGIVLAASLPLAVVITLAVQPLN